MTPCWHQPDQAMIAERDAGRGCKNGPWHLCIHTRYIGTSNTILVHRIKASGKAVTAAIIGRPPAVLGPGREAGAETRESVKGRYGSQTANPVKPWPAGPCRLAEEPRAVRYVFCFNKRHNKPKERPVTNRLSLAAVAYLERWHRDEQIKQVPRPGPSPRPRRKQRHTWMSENTAHMATLLAPDPRSVQPRASEEAKQFFTAQEMQ